MTEIVFTEEQKQEIMEIYQELSLFKSKAKYLHDFLMSDKSKDLSDRERLLFMDKLDALADLYEINKSLADIKLNGHHLDEGCDLNAPFEVANIAELKS